jgi:phosphoglycerate dehydrogenase-like enzyme
MPALDDAMLEKMPSLQAVFYGAGATEAFAPACFRRNVRVFSAWGANAVPVAEFCLAEILLSLKGYYRYVRTLNCRENFNQQLCGPGIYGETVALIGDGAISRKLQSLLKNFNLNVLVVPSKRELRGNLLEEAFRTAMAVSNHLPNNDADAGVLDGRLFSMMRPGAVFINTGRGRQVDEAGMIAVLKERTDLSALLDVTYPEPPEEDSPLYKLPNVFLTPHIAGSLNNEVHRMADFVIDEYCRYAAGEALESEVFPYMLLNAGK